MKDVMKMGDGETCIFSILDPLIYNVFKFFCIRHFTIQVPHTQLLCFSIADIDVCCLDVRCRRDKLTGKAFKIKIV